MVCCEAELDPFLLSPQALAAGVRDYVTHVTYARSRYILMTSPFLIFSFLPASRFMPLAARNKGGLHLQNVISLLTNQRTCHYYLALHPLTRAKSQTQKRRTQRKQRKEPLQVDEENRSGLDSYKQTG